MKTRKIFGKHICLKCGKVDNFRRLKKISSEAEATVCQENQLNQIHMKKFGKPFLLDKGVIA